MNTYKRVNIGNYYSVLDINGNGKIGDEEGRI